MNKFLIVFLAITISVHAFVKRDTEPKKDVNYLDDIKQKFDDFSKDINSKLKETFDAETIKKGINDLTDNLNKMLDGLKKPEEAKQ